MRACSLALLPLSATITSAQGAPIKLALIEPLAALPTPARRCSATWLQATGARERARRRQAAGGARPLQLLRYDSKGSNEEGAYPPCARPSTMACTSVLQGNSSATAAALIEAISNTTSANRAGACVPQLLGRRSPADQRTCNFWHFRFDAHADMRMAALMEVLREDKALKAPT